MYTHTQYTESTLDLHFAWMFHFTYKSPLAILVAQPLSNWGRFYTSPAEFRTEEVPPLCKMLPSPKARQRWDVFSGGDAKHQVILGACFFGIRLVSCMYKCIYLSIYLFIYLSIYLSIHLSMYPCIYVSMYLCIYVCIPYM